MACPLPGPASQREPQWSWRGAGRRAQRAGCPGNQGNPSAGLQECASPRRVSSHRGCEWSRNSRGRKTAGEGRAAAGCQGRHPLTPSGPADGLCFPTSHRTRCNELLTRQPGSLQASGHGVARLLCGSRWSTVCTRGINMQSSPDPATLLIKPVHTAVPAHWSVRSDTRAKQQRSSMNGSVSQEVSRRRILGFQHWTPSARGDLALEQESGIQSDTSPTMPYGPWDIKSATFPSRALLSPQDLIPMTF